MHTVTLHWHQVMEQMAVKHFPEKMKSFPEKTPCLQTYSFFLVWQHKEVILLFFSSVAHSNKKQNLAAACLFFALLAQSKTSKA